jgi:hypothetical protein
MEMYFGNRRIGNSARILLIASAAFLASGPVSADDVAHDEIPTCINALKANYGVVNLSEVYHTHNSGQRTVYTTAVLASGETPRFRCIVERGNRIRRIEVFADGARSVTDSDAGWISAEAYRDRPEPAEVEPTEVEPGEAPVPEASTESESSPVFKKPGSGSGSLFKRPKSK